MSSTLELLAKKTAKAEAPKAKQKETPTVEPEVTEVTDTPDDFKAVEVAEPTPEVSDAPASKTKVVKKSKAKAKAAELDPIMEIAHNVENVTEGEVVDKIGDLLNKTGLDEFHIGGLLAKVQENQWFGEYQSLMTYIEGEIDMPYRKAMHLIAIYRGLVAAQVSWDSVQGFGWSKIAAILPILDADNAAQVLSDISGMTLIQIEEYVKKAKAGTNTAAPTSESDETEKLKSKTFKLYDSQRVVVDLAIEKAKTDTGTESDAAALEFICTDYANTAKKKSTVTPASIDLIEVFKAKLAANGGDVEKTLETFIPALDSVFPKVQFEMSLID